MGLDELGFRLLRRQWWLLLVCVNAAVMLVAVQHLVAPRTYVATVRLLVTDTTPKSSAEAEAVASHARALATSRDLVGAAMRGSGVSGDPAAVAARDVSVSGLGTSPVVALAVSARNGVDAQLVANALGDRVVSSLNAAVNGNLPEVLRQVDKQLDVLSARRAPIAAQAARSPQDILLQSRLAGIDRIISDLSGDRNRLAIESAAGHHAAVVDPAVVPSRPESSHIAHALVLAGLLGLVLGLLLAALREWWSPTVGSLRAIGLFFGAPLLGRLGARPVLPLTANSVELRKRMLLAADSRGATTLAVVGPLPADVVSGAAADLELLCSAVPATADARPAPRGVRSLVGRRVRRPSRTPFPGGLGGTTGSVVLGTGTGRPAGGDLDGREQDLDTEGTDVLTALADSRPADHGRAPGQPPSRRLTVRPYDSLPADAQHVAAVIVTPESVSSHRAEDVRTLLAISGWPVLGVVGIRPNSRYSRRARG